MPGQIKPITHQTYRQAAKVLGQAFVDEPVSKIIYRSFTAERRAKALTVDFSAELVVCLRKGYPIQLNDDGKVVAAALVYPPGTYPLGVIDQWGFLVKSVLGNGWYDFQSWVEWLNETDKLHPTEAHYYLEYIGVDPGFQGKGCGSAIMEHLLAKADEENVGCYLENANLLNISFYQRFGFEIIQEKVIIGIPAWFMWRKPFQYDKS